MTRASSAQLYTDIDPATFWISHPNNTLINNRAAGKAFYQLVHMAFAEILMCTHTHD